MWQACVRLALRQDGLITLNQALAAGCSADCFKRHVAKGDAERLLPGVYRLPGSGVSPRQKLRAACTWGGEGTAASHTSAAAMLGLGGFDLADLHAVTTKYGIRVATEQNFASDHRSGSSGAVGSRKGLRVPAGSWSSGKAYRPWSSMCSQISGVSR
jgi:putative AbiEi antitoxin of type IV toxin-antitoxin system